MAKADAKRITSRGYDMIGRRFGRLLVVERALPFPHNPQKHRRYIVKCDCGAIKVILGYALRNRNTMSCGCLRQEVAPSHAKLKHGDARNSGHAAEYRTWQAMIGRCSYSNNTWWHLYGGRGIKVCQRWRESYEAFLADMGRKPSSRHSIDRINNDGNYEPSNCRWATPTEQSMNRRPRTRRK